MEKVLDIDGFCKALGVSRPTGYQILHSGKIPAVQIGKRGAWRVLEPEVQKFLRGGAEVSSGAEKVTGQGQTQA